MKTNVASKLRVKPIGKISIGHNYVVIATTMSENTKISSR